MESRIVPYIVITQSATVLQLLAIENQALLVMGNAFLVLELLFHVLDGVRGVDIEGDVLVCECLDNNLHRAQRSKCRVRVDSF